jgi:hypothetical protein
VLLLSLIALAGCSKQSQLQEPPIILPLIRTEPVAIDVDFQITEARLYAFGMTFRFPSGNEQERAKVRQAAIGDDADPKRGARGKPLSLDIVVLKREGDQYITLLKHSTDTEQIGLSSWSDDVFNKELLPLSLQSGEYKLLVRVTECDPSLKDVIIDFRLIRPYRGK